MNKKDTYLQIDVLDVIARISTWASSIKAYSLYTTPYVYPYYIILSCEK